MAFDNESTFQNHAIFMLGFVCDQCGDELELDSTNEHLPDEWCAEVALLAEAAVCGVLST